MGPAYEQLFEENKQPKTRLSELKKLVLSLQEQLKLNSKNSSKPPSTDKNGRPDEERDQGI